LSGLGPSLTSRAARGAAWLVAGQLLTRLADLLALLILARLLSPAEFGIVALALTVVVLVETVLDVPVFQSLIRVPVIRRSHLDTAFTLSVIRGTVLGALLAFLALPLATLWDDQRLVPLIFVLTLAPIARSIVSPRLVIFARQLEFRPTLKLELWGKGVAAAVAVTTALTTESYWSIVAGTVTAPLAMAAASYLVAPYTPRLSLREWPAFATFLGWSSASQVLQALSWQSERLLLGSFSTHTELGRFSMARDLSALPVVAFVRPLLATTMAAFCTVSDDLERLRAGYLKVVSGIVIVLVPIMVGLSCLAEFIVPLLLGAKWTGAVSIVKWLALTSVPSLFTAALAALAMAMDETQMLAHRSLIEVLIKLPLVTAGAIWFGISGVVAAVAIVSLLMAAISMSCTRSLIGLSFGQHASIAWRPLASGAVSALVFVAFKPWLAHLSDYLLPGLALTVAVAGGGYGAALVGLWWLSGRPEGLEALALDSVSGRVWARATIARSEGFCPSHILPSRAAPGVPPDPRSHGAAPLSG
jgi:PST family polysaccharide transporter